MDNLRSGLELNFKASPRLLLKGGIFYSGFYGNISGRADIGWTAQEDSIQTFDGRKMNAHLGGFSLGLDYDLSRRAQIGLSYVFMAGQNQTSHRAGFNFTLKL